MEIGKLAKIREAKTSEFLRVKSEIEKFRKAMPRGWGKVTDETADNASSAAKDMLKVTQFSFESKVEELRYKKAVGRKIENFKKFLVDMSKAKNADKWAEFDEKHSTRSKTIWDKVFDFTQLLAGVTDVMSEEVRESFSHGPWTIVLMESSRGSWTDSLVGDLLATLDKAASLVAGAGFGKVVGGRIMAYPQKSIPKRSSGVLAYYHTKQDFYALAASGKMMSIVRTMIHEMGHRFYFRKMGGAGRSAWGKFFGDNVGELPNVDKIISTWEAWIYRNSDDNWISKYGRFLGTRMEYLSKADKEELMWLEMLSDKLKIQEPASYAGYKKNTVPGLDQLIAKKSEAKVFLHPVTAYSGTSAEELFAETFSHIIIDGPSRIPPIVRGAFGRAVPSFKSASVNENLILSTMGKEPVTIEESTMSKKVANELVTMAKSLVAKGAAELLKDAFGVPSVKNAKLITNAGYSVAVGSSGSKWYAVEADGKSPQVWEAKSKNALAKMLEKDSGLKIAKEVSAVDASDYLQIVESMLTAIEGSVEDTRIYLAKYKADSQRFAPQVRNIEYGLKQIRDKSDRAQRMLDKATK